MFPAVRRGSVRPARRIISVRAALRCWRATTWRGARAWTRESLRDRVPTMWRYREVLPVFDGEQPVTLGEGFTPAVPRTRLGATLGLDRLYIKDESLNPTNSFKARGQSTAVTRARALGARTLSIPSAGNAGTALAAYAALRRARGARVPAARRQAAVRARVRALWRAPHARRRAHHRRRARRRRTGRGPRLVRRLHAEGAVPPRGKEDDGLRAGGAARMAAARLDHLSDRRRDGAHRHVEGVRGARSARLDSRRSPAAHGDGAGRGMCADRAGVRAGAGPRRGDRRSPDRRGWTARASRGRRFPDAPRAARERRGSGRRERRVDGRRDAAHRRGRRRERRARRRRRAGRDRAARRGRPHRAAATPSCCSTRAAR